MDLIGGWTVDSRELEKFFLGFPNRKILIVHSLKGENNQDGLTLHTTQLSS